MSKTRKIYFGRLLGRILIFLFAVFVYMVRKEDFSVMTGWNFFEKFTPFHILWGIWVWDMILQLIPIKAHISIGSRKNFKGVFVPIKEKINYKRLKKHITETTISAYKVFVLWCALIAAIGVLYFKGIIAKEEILLISVFFYVCDLICVLIWCPFRLMMGNRCCTTCRIFNWDHLMMFSPFLFIKGFFTQSLFLVSVLIWIIWECCVYLYPERFWENSNMALRCCECTDKLCTQYCRKLRD